MKHIMRKLFYLFFLSLCAIVRPAGIGPESSFTQQAKTNTNVEGWNRKVSEGLAPINVKWYGAKGDGVTDDYASITNMVYSLGKSNVFHFPAGEYLISQPLCLTNLDHIKITGAGKFQTKIRYTGGATESAFIFQNSQYPASEFGMDLFDITLIGNTNCAYVAKSMGYVHSTWENVGLRDATNTVLLIEGGVLNTYRNLSISQVEAQSDSRPYVTPIHCVVIKDPAVTHTNSYSNSLLFENMALEGSSSYGLVLLNGTGNSVFLGGTVEGGAAGILISTNCNSNAFIGVDCENNTGLDLLLDNTSVNNTFTSCLFVTGIEVRVNNTTFTGCRFGNIRLGPDVADVPAYTNKTAVGTTLTGGMWNVGLTNTWIATNAYRTASISTMNAVTGALTNIFNPDIAGGLAPVYFADSTAAPDSLKYQFFIKQDPFLAGVVSWNLGVTNNGLNYSNLTLNPWGKSAFGFLDVIDSSAKLSINGGLNVGSTNDPGAGSILASGSITATNFVCTATNTAPATPGTVVRWMLITVGGVDYRVPLYQ